MHSQERSIKRLGLLAASLLSALLSSQALAKNGYYVMPKSLWPQTLAKSLTAQSSTKLEYYGGPVLANVKVFVVFWGSGVSQQIQTEMPEFYRALAASTAMDWLTEYNTTINAVDGRAGTQQTIGRGSVIGAKVISPSVTKRALTDDDIRKELEAQVKAGALPAPDQNTLYILHFPVGVSISAEGGRSCVEFCGYHSNFNSASLGDVFYGVIPAMDNGGCMLGCGGGGVLSDTTNVSSHEFMEAVTDPMPTPGDTPSYPQAWNTSNGAEIGDLCVGQSTTLTTANKIYNIQQEWDNARGACSGDPATSP